METNFGLLESIIEKEKISKKLIRDDFKEFEDVYINIDRKKKVNALDKIIKVFKYSNIKWKVIEDKYVDYPEFNAKFRMFIIKKLS